MTRNEILENLFKRMLNPRIESLERDDVSQISDLKLCSSIVKEVDILFNEIKSLFLNEACPESKDNVYISRVEELSNQNLTTHGLKREKTPPLQTSKSNLKLKPSKPLETSPISKKPIVDNKLNISSANKPSTLTKTKTVANLKTTPVSSSINLPSKTPKDENMKSKISLKIDSGIDSSTPKAAKANGPNIKELPKFEKSISSKPPIANTKLESLNTSSLAKKSLVKHQTSKGPLIKTHLEESKGKQNKSVSSSKDVTRVSTQAHINNIILTPEIHGVKSEVVEIKLIEKETQPKKPIIDYNDLLSNNWVHIGRFLCKNDLFSSKLITKKLNKHTLLYYLSGLEQDVKIFEEKLTSLKEKNKEDELNKPLNEFSLGRSAAKALDLLNQEKYKELFRNEKVPQVDIILPYRIYFTFMNKKDIYRLEDAEFWKECCKYFLSDVKTGEFISNSVKSFDFSNETIFKIYRLTNNKDKKLLPSYYSKICSTTGIVIFLIKDTLEYIGLMSTDKKTTPVANKLNKLFNAILEQSKIRIDYLKELTK